MHPGFPRLRAGAIALLFGPAMLAGCGSSSSAGSSLASKTPAQILAAAETAAAGAATVHVKGSIVGAGKPISLNMELIAGKGGKGRIALDGLGVELIHVDGSVYVKGSAAFDRRVAGAEAPRILTGTWLKGSATGEAFASLASLSDLDKLLEGTLAAHGPLSSAGQVSVHGQRAVGVSDSAGDGTLYVAATGTPYPIEIIKRGTDGGTVTFDRWNEPVTLEVPSNAINVKQLQNGD